MILDMRDDRAFYVGAEKVAASEAALSTFLRSFEKGALERNAIALPSK
jgi:hypothetical protein